MGTVLKHNLHQGTFQVMSLISQWQLHLLIAQFKICEIILTPLFPSRPCLKYHEFLLASFKYNSGPNSLHLTPSPPRTGIELVQCVISQQDSCKTLSELPAPTLAFLPLVLNTEAL